MQYPEIKEDALTENVIGAAIEVHKRLGPGLLESTYQICMGQELQHRNLRFAQEIELPVVYRDVKLAVGYRVDMIVEEELLLELKVVNRIEAVHKAQLLTYLRLSEKPRGLLINFNVPFLKEGLHRIVNNYKPGYFD